jgi:hypothetical protein
MRRAPKSPTATQSVVAKIAFFHRVGAWADAVECGDFARAQMELRLLKVLGPKVAVDECFGEVVRRRGLANSTQDLVSCFHDYLSALTESLPNRGEKALITEQPNGESKHKQN